MKIDEVIEKLRPEAKELVKLCLKDMTTKHGYGKMMGFAGTMPNPTCGKLFLLACIKEGYPKETAAQVARLLWG